MAFSTNKTELFNRLLQGRLSPEDTEELVEMLAKDEPDPQMAELLMQHLQTRHTQQQVGPEITAALEARLPAILSKAQQQRTSRVAAFRSAWVHYSAAAAIIIVATGVWWVNKTEHLKPLYRPVPVVLNKEITPGRQGAILTLDDGQTILLDSMNNGVVATQNGSKVLLDNGRLTYNKEGVVTDKPTYNTMTTPKGRQFQLLLPDGTKVWLDAASSISYPTAFTGAERDVQVTGEVYFEVSKNPSMPFHVKIKDKPAEIKVLGTHFNINAYGNEASISTTLLEGSVQVSNGNEQAILKPGQQAQTGSNIAKPGINIITNVNIPKVMAWKEGVFDFGDATLEEVMRQLERWYDIEVVYEKGIPPLEFVGKMSRDLSLSEVLRGLEVSEVHFSVEGRKLIVRP